jgi:hypothetical protein
MDKVQNWSDLSNFLQEKEYLKFSKDLGFFGKKVQKFPEFYFNRPRLSIREVKKKFEKMKK